MSEIRFGAKASVDMLVFAKQTDGIVRGRTTAIEIIFDGAGMLLWDAYDYGNLSGDV
jgi:hypothetical protein